MSRSTLDLIAERNALDVSLYEYAKSRLVALISKEGPDFNEQVSAFRVKNDHWNRHGQTLPAIADGQVLR